MLVTFCSNVYFPDTDFEMLINHITADKDVKKLVCVMPDCVVFVTNKGYTITIRLVGPKKLVDMSDATANNDGSFEVEVDLSQQVRGLPSVKTNYYATPRK